MKYKEICKWCQYRKKNTQKMFGINNDYISESISNICRTEEFAITLLQEECAELIHALSKYRRGDERGLDMIKEEITHVAITSAEVSRFLGITQNDINEEVQKKSDKYGFIHNNVS